jgi:hypothetical protein
MHVDDAAAFIVDCLQKPRSNDGYPSFGYNIWLPNVIVAYIREVEHSIEALPNLRGGRRVNQLSAFFYDAAWGLCRRGIFRPGIKDARGPGPADGAGPDGYCLTNIGRSWIDGGAPAIFSPILTDSRKCSASSRRSLVPGSLSERPKLSRAIVSMLIWGAAPCVERPPNRSCSLLLSRKAETRRPLSRCIGSLTVGEK